ncbi:MAG: PAS domain S-box protein, partial [Desulfobacca sp.]|uniref:PAS domain S-box protein n=1 Tax=Desulfobacca sp. TaxID=2067990 RepID=UPI00404ACDE1
QSEAGFRSLVDGAPDAIFVQTDQRFAYLNESACRLFGAEAPAQLLGQPVMARFHPALREVIAQRITLLNDFRQKVPVMEQVYLRLDGSPVPVEVSAVPLHYEGKDGALVFVRDITARKAAEQELQRRQLMLARTEAIAHVGSWEWDLATKTVTWSDELFRILQRDPAEGPPPFAKHQELFMPEDMRRLSRAMARAVKRGLPFRLELRAVRPDGSVRYCLGHGFPELDNGRKVVRLYGSLQDITDFKMAQERIVHLNTVLRAIRDINQLIVRESQPELLIQQGVQLLVGQRSYAGVLIALVDQEQQISAWAMAGFEALQDRLTAYLQENKMLPCFLLAAAQDGVIVKNQGLCCDLCHSGPDCTNITSLCSPLRHGDTTFGYLVAILQTGLKADAEEIALFAEMAADLAYALHVIKMEEVRRVYAKERQALEERLFQSQKLEAVGRLAGGVAHDFNNMLSVILGHAEMALLKLTPEHPLYPDLQEIMKAANRSADLTRQLLAFARRQNIAPRVLDLNQTLAGMLQMLRRLIGEEIELIWLPGTDIGSIRMDPAQIHQILVNLCINARDAIDGVGKITIETGRTTLTEDYCAKHPACHPGEFVLLAVSDNGKGMDQETLATIFEPFFTTKDVGEGTGLGLAMVYGIIRQNHGLINVYSEPGQGTTFKIYLPCSTGADQVTPPDKEMEPPRSRGETILIVEDEPALRQVSQMMLASLGYTTITAGSAAEALQLVQSHPGPIHLLLTDVIMPQMNGKTLAQEIQRRYPECRTVFVSGYTANVIAQRGIIESGVHFLAKPFTLQDLAVKVRNALDQTVSPIGAEEGI